MYRDRPAESGEERVCARPLRPQLVGHRLALRVVAGVQLAPVDRVLRAKAAGDRARGERVDERERRVDGAEECTDRHSIAAFD